MKKILMALVVFLFALTIGFGCGDDPVKVEDKVVTQLIADISELSATVTLDDATTINGLMTRYNALTEKQKAAVTNSTKLLDAKTALDALGGGGNQGGGDDVTEPDELNPYEWKGNGEEIVIKVYPVAEYDPYNSSYSGTSQAARQLHQRKVETAFNVKIKYENYGDVAAWGPNRVKWINNQYTGGLDDSQVYLIDASWIPSLVKGQSVQQLFNGRNGDGYLTEVDYEMDETYMKMNMVKGNVYGYNLGAPRAESYMYFNSDLVNDLGIENPVDKWEAGEWSWTDFVNYLNEFKTVAGSDSYALDGWYAEYAFGLVGARGGQFVETEPDRLNLTSSSVTDPVSDLQDLVSKGYWAPNPGDVSENFAAGKSLFHHGSFWFLKNDMRFGQCSFEIGVVPFPYADEDPNKENFTIPIDYTSSYAFNPLGKGDLTALQVFQVFDALQRKEPVDESKEGFTEEELFELFLGTKLDSQKYIDIILDTQIPEYRYFEMIKSLSKAANDGSDYGPTGFAVVFNSLIKGSSSGAHEEPRTKLQSILEDYRTAFEEIGYNPA